MMLENIWFEAFLIFVLILANGFFAASEIAMIATRKSRIDALLERGKSGLGILERITKPPEEPES